MTRDDIIRMAKEVNLSFEQFAIFIAAHEREECAKVCEKLAQDHKEYWRPHGKKTEWAKSEALTHCAELLRASKKNEQG
jgi:hypothetical protein